MKQLFIFSFLLISLVCFSQNKKKDNPYKNFGITFAPGILVQKEIFTEFNIGIGNISTDFRPKMVNIIGFQGFRLGLETNFKSDENFIIAPKIGYEKSISFYSLRLTALNYFQNNQSEFRILPEVGISIGGLINLTYGYGIGFSNTINGISNHRLSLSFNFNKRIYNAVRKYKR